MTTQKNKIVSKLISASNGVYGFDITNAGTIGRATISDGIKFGDMFEIEFGDGHYVPKQKEQVKWLGKKGIGGYLVGDLEKSISKSAVFIGESMDSSAFYELVAKKHCDCHCDSPALKHGSESERKVIAFDLDTPTYSRDESRNLIYLSVCVNCSKALTHGTGVGSFHTTGEDELKALAEKTASVSIDFDSIITSRKQLI